MASQPKQTFGGVDLLRFIAAVMVMFYHYGFWVWAYPDGMAGQAAGVILPQRGLGQFTSSGWVGVPIFFVISGFIIAFSAENSTPLMFVWARVKRLGPAVWICAPITVIVALCVGTTWPHDAVLKLLRTEVFWPFSPWVDSVYWTLGVEIAFYSIVWALLATGRFYLIETVAAIIGLASGVFWVCFFVFGLTPLAEDRTLDLILIHHGCFFALGVMIWLVRFKGMTAQRIGLSLVFVAAGVLQIVSSVSATQAKITEPMYALPPIILFLLAIGFMVASLQVEMSWAGWRKVGMMTYPLYLIHDLVGAAVIGKLVFSGVNYEVAMAISAALMIVVSWLIAVEAEPRIRELLDSLLFRYRLRTPTS
ncbi:acyltransferase family protein [Mesorhizobium sp. URHB0026]